MGGICLLSFIFLVGCQSPGARAYYRGNAEYLQKNYEQAFANYLYAARQGITPAQYAVGYQYFTGQGTKRDEVKSIHWFEKAKIRSIRATDALNRIQSDRPIQPWILGIEPHLTPIRH